jgi:hypothetical protein
MKAEEIDEVLKQIDGSGAIKIGFQSSWEYSKGRRMSPSIRLDLADGRVAWFTIRAAGISLGRNDD